MHTSKNILIASIILFISASIMSIPLVSGTVLSNPATINDPVTFGGFHDLQEVSVTDNGTHLIIHVQMNGTKPVFTSTSYRLEANRQFHLDADDNISTGFQPSYLWLAAYYQDFPIGSEAFIDMNDTGVVMTVYNPDGSIAYTINLNYVSNSSGFYTYIPLSTLNLSVDDVVRIRPFNFKTEVYDFLPNATNVTMVYANITVDGDPSDWNSSMLVSTDSGDNVTITYPNFNATAFYAAVGSEFFYMMFNFTSINTVYYTNPIDHTFSGEKLHVYLDEDNDGNPEYYLRMTPGFVDVFNVSGVFSLIGRYPRIGGDYDWSTSTSNVEVGINLSILGLSNASVGNLSFTKVYYHVSIYDEVVPSSATGYGLMYKIGSGGYFLYSYNAYSNTLNGLATVSLGDLNMTFNTSSSTVLKAIELNESPTLNSILGLVVSKYYKFIVKNESAIIWPINASINYNETLLAANSISEDSLRVYYYNGSLGRYVLIPANNTIIDTVNNRVYFNITQDIYDAGRGDPVILLGGPPPVGGELVVYKTISEGNASIIVLVLVGLTAIIISGTLVYKHKNTGK